MRRVLKFSLALLAFVTAMPFVIFAVYDLAVFQPRMAEIRALVVEADPDEISPPESLLKVLRVAYPKHLSAQVARLLLYKLEIYPNNGVTFQWHLVSAAWGALLELHLSESERITLFLNLSYMGNKTTGFARASKNILGVSLNSVSLEQAARLVVVSKSPSAFLQSPERLTRFSENLASRAKNAF